MEMDGTLVHIERQLGQSAVVHFLEFGWVFAPVQPRGDSLIPRKEVYRLYKGFDYWEITLLLCESEEEHKIRFERTVLDLARDAKMEEIELLAGLGRIGRFREEWIGLGEGRE